MSALFSSNIDFLPHQVEVARRVLEDPIQRYLLADEVGLGKTIEAGIILRQFVLDNPNAKALIVVPNSLLKQWKKELEEKFYLTNQINIISTESIYQNSPQKVDFLIIDEAHHIAAMATATSDEKQKIFQYVRDLAHQAKGLLLLSATPALNHEQEFLAMLHLLDPQAYSLEDLDEFKKRINLRQDIGRILLSFKETAHSFILKRNIQQLKQLFGDDNALLTYLDSLQTQLDTDASDKDKIEKLVRSIRVYISNVYRLHRRMLRNRRASLEDILFDQSNATLQIEYDNFQEAERIHEYLDEWRIQALSQAEQTSDEWVRLYRLFQILYLASGTWHRVLEWAIATRLENHYPEEVLEVFGKEGLRILRETPYFDGEQDLLKAILDLLSDISDENDRITQLQRLISQLHVTEKLNSTSKLVIFTSYTPVCKEIVNRLRHRFGDVAVATLQKGQSAEESEKNKQQFKNNPRCLILVGDIFGEEGQNLQSAQSLIHFDLPLSPNRIEQRHGRINRIGQESQAIKYIIFSGSKAPDDIHLGWTILLGDGFNIFKESIASLQFYIDKKLPEIKKTLFEEGMYGCETLIDILNEEIKAEKIRINEQYILDEIDALNEEASKYFRELDEYDANHQNIKVATQGWLKGALQLKPWYTDSSSLDFFYYKWTSDTLIPQNELLHFLPAYELQKSGTYNRRKANNKPGQVLFRSGSKVIDAFAEYVKWDDRGRAFALWRHSNSWSQDEGMEWLGFRFDYIVETDLSEVEYLLKQPEWRYLNLKGIQRLADSLFSPIFKTVYLDLQMNTVEDQSLLDLLQFPYHQNGQDYQDFNLAKDRLEIIDNFISRDDWGNLCRNARQNSEEHLRSSEEFRDYCETYRVKANRKLDERLEQLKIRLIHNSEFSSDKELQKEVEIEKALQEALLQGIIKPRISLDSIGFYIVAGYSPFINQEEQNA
jgi:ATP-dependent helicase HepA